MSLGGLTCKGTLYTVKKNATHISGGVLKLGFILAASDDNSRFFRMTYQTELTALDGSSLRSRRAIFWVGGCGRGRKIGNAGH